MRRKPFASSTDADFFGLPEGEYLVVNPHAPRRRDLPLSALGLTYTIFPPNALCTFTSQEAFVTLYDLNVRWIYTSGWPAPELAPWIELIRRPKRLRNKPVTRGMELRGKDSYTLEELVERALRRLAREHKQTYRRFVRFSAAKLPLGNERLQLCLPAVRRSVELA